MMDAYTQFLGTLANVNRVKLLLALKDKDLSVSELIKKLNMNQTTISHNLKRLQICGFVDVEQKGKFRIYSINHKTIEPLLELMERHMVKYCCHVVNDKNISKKYKSSNL